RQDVSVDQLCPRRRAAIQQPRATVVHTGSLIYGAPMSDRKNIFETDFSQLEQRVLAQYIRPRGKSILFEEEKVCFGMPLSPDIWKIFAADLFGVRVDQVTPNMRSAAKGIGWLRFYGGSPQKEFDQIIKHYGPSLGLHNRLRYRRRIIRRAFQ